MHDDLASSPPQVQPCGCPCMASAGDATACCLMKTCAAVLPEAGRRVVILARRYPLQAVALAIGIGTLAWWTFGQESEPRA